MEIKIDKDVTNIEEISAQSFNVHKVNSIKSLYPEVRQQSKAPTFALTQLPL